MAVSCIRPKRILYHVENYVEIRIGPAPAADGACAALQVNPSPFRGSNQPLLPLYPCRTPAIQARVERSDEALENNTD
jgi:hypothetical protein